MDVVALLIRYGKKTDKVIIRAYDSNGEVLYKTSLYLIDAIESELSKYFDNEYLNDLMKTFLSKSKYDLYKFKNRHNNVVRIREGDIFKKLLISLDLKQLSVETYRYTKFPLKVKI